MVASCLAAYLVASIMAVWAIRNKVAVQSVEHMQVDTTIPNDRVLVEEEVAAKYPIVLCLNSDSFSMYTPEFVDETIY